MSSSRDDNKNNSENIANPLAGSKSEGTLEYCNQQFSSSQLANCPLTRIEDFELHIVGFMPLTNSDDLKSLSFAILHSVSPTININEIESVRLLNTQISPDADDNTTEGRRGASVPNYPSFITRLTSSSRVRQIMSNKHKLNYFNTRDLDISLIDMDLASRIPYTKILINEALSSYEYKKFRSLKSIGKSLGFKNIWHRRGMFLARWRSWEQEHFFDCLSDLNTIRSKYCSEVHKDLCPLTTISTSNTTPNTCNNK